MKLAPHPGGHVPPHPSVPHVLPAQLGVQQAPALQTCPTTQQAAPQLTFGHVQVPDEHVKLAPHPGGQVPPQALSPHVLPPHAGAQHAFW